MSFWFVVNILFSYWWDSALTIRTFLKTHCSDVPMVCLPSGLPCLDFRPGVLCLSTLIVRFWKITIFSTSTTVKGSNSMWYRFILSVLPNSVYPCNPVYWKSKEDRELRNTNRPVTHRRNLRTNKLYKRTYDVLGHTCVSLCVIGVMLLV